MFKIYIIFKKILKLLNLKKKLILFNKKYFIIHWGLGIGDWGLGIGDWGLGIGANPQSPIPNPHFIRKYNFYLMK